MSSKLEPPIWSCDAGQQIPCFDRCQLTITWMSNVKEVCYQLEYGCHVARLCYRCRLVYLPMSDTASHDNHEKINAWVSFTFLYGYDALLHCPLGCQCSAIRLLIDTYFISISTLNQVACFSFDRVII